MDSFKPMLDVEKREDMFDLRMFVLRIASAGAIFYGASEFLKEPENLENLLSGSGEVWNDMFEWGQNKFLGNPDNSTQVQMKKSARQIYAEAFMDDLDPLSGNRQRFYDDTDYSVDPDLKSGEPEWAEPVELDDDEVAIEDLDAPEAEDVLDFLTKEADDL